MVGAVGLGSFYKTVVTRRRAIPARLTVIRRPQGQPWAQQMISEPYCPVAPNPQRESLPQRQRRLFADPIVSLYRTPGYDGQQQGTTRQWGPRQRPHSFAVDTPAGSGFCLRLAQSFGTTHSGCKCWSCFPFANPPNAAPTEPNSFDRHGGARRSPRIAWGWRGFQLQLPTVQTWNVVQRAHKAVSSSGPRPSLQQQLLAAAPYCGGHGFPPPSAPVQIFFLRVVHGTDCIFIVADG